MYCRLNVFPITCPPLRERKDDIPLLVKHFCQKHEGNVGRKINEVALGVLEALIQYDWPGNIRELEIIIERAMILSRGTTIESGDWGPRQKIAAGRSVQSFVILDDFEKEHITEALKSTKWKISGDNGAAKILGLKPTILEARMRKLRISREK